MSQLESTYLENYQPLLMSFAASLEGLNLSNVPEPHLPVFGETYETAKDKILFMGWETRGSKGLAEFIHVINENPKEALFWWNKEFRDFEFVYWRSNFGRDFWSFNLQFLARFYGVEDWRNFYYDPRSYSDILSSIAWANANSIERYEVTAEKIGVDHSTWFNVYKASDIFDNPHLIFNTLKPTLTILTYWNHDQERLLKGLEIESIEKPFPDYLWHIKVKNPDMHLFWTKHPIRLSLEGIKFNDVIDQIISIYRKTI